jgi:MurNAc alpha-1-phosphate uridylyltransferase
MTKVTQAFIFAAGRGERMRPLTDTIPKPLVKINGKAIIDYAIEKLDKIESIKKIIINGFYLADELENHIKKLNNPKIIFSRENEKLETAGGLVFAANEIDLGKPLLTVNGDVLWVDTSVTSDIELICNSWNYRESDVLLGLKKIEYYSGYDGDGDFDLVNKDILYRFPGMKMTHAFVGLQIIHPRVLEKVKDKCCSMSFIYKEAVAEEGLVHRIKGVELKGDYFHIGTVDAIDDTEGKL